MTGTVKSKTKRLTAQQRREKKYRGEFFPELDVSDVWDRSLRKGFTTIPRSMPLIGKCMDYLAGKGTPVYETYLALWFRVHDYSFVEIQDPLMFAEESGFSGAKAVSSWRKRMKILEDLGFIETKEGTHTYSYVLIYNPHQVIKRYEKSIPERLRNLLYRRCIEIGAEDYTE